MNPMECYTYISTHGCWEICILCLADEYVSIQGMSMQQLQYIHRWLSVQGITERILFLIGIFS